MATSIASFYHTQAGGFSSSSYYVPHAAGPVPPTAPALTLRSSTYPASPSSASASSSSDSNGLSSPPTPCFPLSEAPSEPGPKSKKNKSKKKKNKSSVAGGDHTTEASGDHCSKRCTCDKVFRSMADCCLPPLLPKLQSAVDAWKSDASAWEGEWGHPSRLINWDELRGMYDTNQPQPITSEVIDSVIKVFNQFFNHQAFAADNVGLGPSVSGQADAPRRQGTLFLPTAFYNTLRTFCVCTDGKCKYKLNVPLESSLCKAGWEGVRLFDFRRICFPLKLKGSWLAFMLDTNAQTNIVYDPCGLYYSERGTVSRIAQDLINVLAMEVQKHRPTTYAGFEKKNVHVLAPKSPINDRYSGLLMLTALEIFARTGLPDQPTTASLYFTTLADLMALGGSAGWDASVDQYFADRTQHKERAGTSSTPNASSGPDANDNGAAPQAQAKPKPRMKKPKNLKARIATANANINGSANVSTRGGPAASATACRAGAHTAAAPEYAQSSTSKGDRSLQFVMTTNQIEQKLLDRLAVTLGLGIPVPMALSMSGLADEKGEKQGAAAARGKAKAKGRQLAAADEAEAQETQEAADDGDE